MQNDEYTIKEETVSVGDGHKIYTQLWGSEDAQDTILFLHGGPGSGCNDGHKQMFNPKTQRVLFHDQRGAGNSTPKGSLAENTTSSLVQDICKIAKHYDIDSFVVTGGSWGSTLALVLAIQQPELVKSLVVRGVFTARKFETDHLDKGGFRNFFPEVWERYVNSVPAKYAEDPSSYHVPRILGDDEAAAKKSAYEYDLLECSVLRRDDRISLPDFDEYDKAGITIEVNYLANDCYLEEGYILNHASKIQAPLFIVQGRYDVICPPVTAYELHKAVPGSQYITTDAGHSGGDRSNYEVVKSILEAITN